LFARTTAEFGTVDIRVNNAAVYSFQPLEEITEGEFRRHYDTNVLGPILTLQEYLKHAPAQGGSVVNVVTAGLSANGPGSALYTSTKGHSPR
jgi:3-oxoacyl-[acyl-carrier protein] reductase